ncbi:MTMR2 [Symbiodinium sp. CCMP2592]|nr:MTMR2 [Symbiodinium sp. CCMP2592]
MSIFPQCLGCQEQSCKQQRSADTLKRPRQVTEICDRVAKEPREAALAIAVPEAVRLLAGAFAEKGGLPRRKLKALTIMNELLYDKRAEAELRQVHGVRDALWTLQTTSNSGLGPEADEQIRMFATEVEKKCFGASGDPFAAPALVPEDPFTLPVVNSVPAPAPLSPLSPAKDSMKDVGSSMLGALWQVGSQMTSAVKATAPRVEIPRFAMRPGASRPNLDVSFEGMLPGEKVHYAVNPAVLLINKPFREVQGRLLISNYRLKFQVPKGTWKDNLAWIGEKQLLDIPLGLIETLELEAPTSQAGAQQWRLVDGSGNFPFVCFWLPLAAESLGSVNSAYQLCDTYPAFLALPRCIKDEELRSVASFRKRGRLPTMSWCGGRTRSFASLWRCSQPTEGLMGNNCQSDEKMLYAIRLGATAGRNRELLVLDLRPRKAAYANKVGGGGFESYSGCRLVFGGIDNVHVVRDAWKKMGQAVANLSNDEVGSWFRDVANSGWYDLIGAIFNCALMIVHEIESHHCNVVIHCSDGWDRTAQVSSVAMLCMDPYYRTVRGLLLLIQKEFCSFGHRFRTRLANGEKPTSEYSPVFLQWLECVYQLLVQFPTAFEFTSDLLLFLAREVLTNRYGTFLTDCERERTEQAGCAHGFSR